MPYLSRDTCQYIFNRQLEFLTDAGKSAMSKVGTINKIYMDPENVETIAPGYTFLIHKTAAAFVNKAWNPLGPVNAQAEAGVYALWSEQSSNIPGVYYDIITKETCESNEFYLLTKIQLHGNSPSSLRMRRINTGILHFSVQADFKI